MSIPERISKSSNKKFALLIDEYDSLVIHTLKSDNYDEYFQLNEFFIHVFSSLKGNTEAIPFQFITGSSHIVIKGFWSGGNNIEDLSSSPLVATILGYTWEEIEADRSRERLIITANPMGFLKRNEN